MLLLTVTAEERGHGKMENSIHCFVWSDPF